MLKVLVVSDVRLNSEGLACVLAQADAGHETQTAPTVLDALPTINEWTPGAVLLAAPVAGGPQAVEVLKWKFPGLPVIVLGAPDYDAASWMEAGADAVLPQEAPLDELHRYLEHVADGEQILPTPRVTALVFERLRADARRRSLDPVRSVLTRQECNVASLVTEGLRDKEIAARLHIAPATVKCHVHRIRRKLGVRSRTEIALQLRGS